ncbi:hypothetical protein BSPWISOXPB_6464 [uncultured Gammaproteobacteria bacterium]|nr:hypothetical protein BSPWISOXPB_6464 [uncultured Gammaproteobacteria bacterium]
MDILSPIISAPYDNDNLFHFPAAYQRLEESVKHHSINRIDEYTILDTKQILLPIQNTKVKQPLKQILCHADSDLFTLEFYGFFYRGIDILYKL